MSRKPKSRSVRKSAPARSRSRPAARKTPETLDGKIRRLVREAIREEMAKVQDRIDSLASEASLADGVPIPAEEVWKKARA